MIFTTLFKKPQAQAIVKNSLADYERHLLEHEAAASYHAKMSEYYAEGIARLQAYPMQRY